MAVGAAFAGVGGGLTDADAFVSTAALGCGAGVPSGVGAGCVAMATGDAVGDTEGDSATSGVDDAAG